MRSATLTMEGLKTTGKPWRSDTENLLSDLYGSMPYIMPPIMGWATQSWFVCGYGLAFVSILFPHQTVRTTILLFRVCKRIIR